MPRWFCETRLSIGADAALRLVQLVCTVPRTPKQGRFRTRGAAAVSSLAGHLAWIGRATQAM